MFTSFLSWLRTKWTVEIDANINQSYQSVFGTPDGVKVLHHLLDRFYCVTYNGTNTFELGTLNGQRTVLQEILERLDLAENPRKYSFKQEEMEHSNA